MDPTHTESKNATENELIYNGKYKKIRNKPIGQGSFGCVYLVQDINTNEKYFDKTYLIITNLISNFKIK